MAIRIVLDFVVKIKIGTAEKRFLDIPKLERRMVEDLVDMATYSLKNPEEGSIFVSIETISYDNLMVNETIKGIDNLDVFIVAISISKVVAELAIATIQPVKPMEPIKLVEPFVQAILVEEAVQKDQQLLVFAISIVLVTFHFDDKKIGMVD